ncbi:hypothetical protein H6G89_25650 [Oscillatoria sp. FACHB-1407]|uniref:hypothetical protein n=1 Tax=Oscillatoria sp. FACHB-1407 TaxID=2692847 RepID=UPI00168515AC|nr:hypothetical protein [Oscillatoria sp. FACHB-1407]MBD2464395.1 hypothetical protein [Oscillatoria sp. FACHB-1407]
MTLHSLTRIFPSRYSLFRSLEKPLAGLFVAIGLMGVAAPHSATYAIEAPTTANHVATQVAQASAQTLADGVYLYGQATEPEQIGSAYMVFEVNQNQVVGAFYMPYSSFDCFRGEFQSDRLALNVVDSYEQTVNPYSIALESNGSVASTGEAIAPVGLEGFNRLEGLSDNDRRILATCQADQ